MKIIIDFDTANDSLAWQETDAVHIVLTEVFQADGILTREWYGEITANDPLLCAQSITDSLGFEIDVCANGQPVSYLDMENVDIRLKL
jgi:hypothetical protein